MGRPAPSRGGRRRRCAIYTRKSSEEGLEQEFNSLHAQREACEAYITSQRHEGWTCLPQSYDDGGLSGATMDRPALQQLLADIQAGKVDVVVTYKVDRLTRSLADFAKIVEIFDAKGVSFVSVTQQFNTTTSMGRLTLNVLLSFASSSGKSQASASATRLPPRRRRACGWAACRRSATFPNKDLALFQAARLTPIAAGAALFNILRRNSGWAGTATGSLPTARATALSAQLQFCRVRSGSASSAATRAIRSAKVGRVASAKGFRDGGIVAIKCLMMTGDESRYFS
jgi:predicted site-specific integrase-resolvase